MAARSLALAVLLAGCATPGMPEIDGRPILAMRAAPSAGPQDAPSKGVFFRAVAVAPGPGVGDRLREASLDWARRHSIHLRGSETQAEKGWLRFAPPNEEGVLLLVYRVTKSEVWVVMSHKLPRGQRVRGGGGERLAREFAADSLATALERAMAIGGSTPIGAPGDGQLDQGP